MFVIYEVNDTVRIPPALFGGNLKKVALQQLKEKYENTFNKDMGYIIFIEKVKVDKVGKIYSKDGSSFHDVKLDLITFTPIINEITEGEVVEITNFGVFVRLGPMDALLHISQIINDFVTVDTIKGTIIGKESNKILRVNDKIRVRIVAFSLPKGVSAGKIGLTCRQPFLGKLEWIHDATKKSRGEKIATEQ